MILSQDEVLGSLSRCSMKNKNCIFMIFFVFLYGDKVVPTNDSMKDFDERFTPAIYGKSRSGREFEKHSENLSGSTVKKFNLYRIGKQTEPAEIL